MVMPSPILITNVTAVTPYELVPEVDILVEEGQIRSMEKHFSQAACPPGSRELAVVDGTGLYAAPGFIDIHVHGGGGHDFMDATVEAFNEAARTHVRHGTTTMIPTTLAARPDVLDRTLNAFAQVRLLQSQGGWSGAHLHGLHIEGPYFAMAQRGAQDPRYLRNPMPVEYEQILRKSGPGTITRWSAACELPGALEFGQKLVEWEILPSIGHSDATCEEVEQALTHGWRHVTHLYSCMSTIKREAGYRTAGLVEAAYLYDDLTVEVIADGCHLPSSLLKLAYRLKGPDKVALVTDAMRAAGMPEGESILGSLDDGQRVIVEDGVAKLPDRSAFAGSVATADRLVWNMVGLAGIPLNHAVQMITLTPAKIMGIDNARGSLEVKKEADIVLFGEGIDIRLVMVGGKVVWEDGSTPWIRP